MSIIQRAFSSGILWERLDITCSEAKAYPRNMLLIEATSALKFYPKDIWKRQLMNCTSSSKFEQTVPFSLPSKIQISLNWESFPCGPEEQKFSRIGWMTRISGDLALTERLSPSADQIRTQWSLSSRYGELLAHASPLTVTMCSRHPYRATENAW